MTAQAVAALRQADVVIGYSGYFAWVEDMVHGKECNALPLTQETERAHLAVERAREGRSVCVISSGDPGVYGMASLVLEHAAAEGHTLDVVIVPGVSAVNAAAALLGAPLGHDFAVVSLSDLLTPWEQIARRLHAAAEADFVLAMLNPRSQRRDWQLRKAREILLCHRRAETPVGVVRNAYRAGQSMALTTLGMMDEAEVDMFSTVIVGNSQTRMANRRMVTPRGYPHLAPLEPPAAKPREDILPHGIITESFRIIDAEVGAHSFDAREWRVARRMIHASGDVELVRQIHFSPDAVDAGIQALRAGSAMVTDVRMVATGIQRYALEALGVKLHCFIDDPESQNQAGNRQVTRSHMAMEKAIAVAPEAIFVVGNAPTALLALCDAVRRQAARPRLIVAMPVGFVSVTESKEAALVLGVPVMTVRGRKGGSAVAAAAVNALLELAREETP
jgi:precorrin-3B C17-methyltransferase